jgi:hypothetical protein
MENNSLKNQITVNGNTKAENVFNQLYQNQIALTRLSSAFELIQLSESELDSTYQAKFTNHPENTKENQNGCQQNR